MKASRRPYFGENVHITTVSHLVPQYKCTHIPKTSELIDSRYGVKYKTARNIFCVGFTPITVTTGCLLLRHCNRPGSVVQVSV